MVSTPSSSRPKSTRLRRCTSWKKITGMSAARAASTIENDEGNRLLVTVHHGDPHLLERQVGPLLHVDHDQGRTVDDSVRAAWRSSRVGPSGQVIGVGGQWRTDPPLIRKT